MRNEGGKFLPRLEIRLTEIGRRTAILVGTGAFAISVLIGVFSDGDLVMVSLKGLAACLIFGTGGLLIGNLVEAYIVQAARREVARRAVEKQLAAELAAQREESVRREKAVAAAEAAE